MESDATDDQRVLIDASARFVEEMCPLEVVRAGGWKDGEFSAAYRKQAAELGWFSMLVPEHMGGGSVSGNGMLDAALIASRRGELLQPGQFVDTNVVAYALAHAGSEGACSEILPALMSGEMSASWVVASSTEGIPLNGHVDARSLSDGGLVLSGASRVVMDAGGPSWLLVTCTAENGAIQALVAAHAPGVTVNTLDALDLSRRFVEVHLDSVRVDASAVLESPGTADELLDSQLAVACTLLTAETVGAMSRDFDVAVQYAKSRIAFGRPIGSFQAVKHQLADTSLALEMSKAIVLAAARSVGAEDDRGVDLASMAKSFVGDVGTSLAQTCFQIFGGIGFTWEHDQHLYLRRITTDAALFGDAAWHRERLCQRAGV